MAISSVASQRSYKAITASGSAGALTVLGGATTSVCGILVLNTTADTIWTVYDADDTVLFTFQHAVAKTSHTCDVKWMADNGIKVGNDKGTGAVTVFHNGPGG